MISKVLLLTTLLIICQRQSRAQQVTALPADSIILKGNGGNAELIIENATRNINGYLYNTGNGRTEFRAVASSDAWGSSGNGNAGNSFIGSSDSSRILLRTNNLARGNLFGNGVVSFGMNDTAAYSPFVFYPNGDFRFSAKGREYASWDDTYKAGLRFNRKMGYLEMGGTTAIFDQSVSESLTSGKTSALILQGDDPSSFSGRMQSFFGAAYGIGLGAGKMISFSSILGGVHLVNDTVSNSLFNGVYQRAYGGVMNSFVGGHGNFVWQKDINSLWSGHFTQSFGQTYGNLTGGSQNSIGSSSQLTEGMFNVNRGYASTALGNSIVNFTALPYNSWGDYAGMVIQPDYPLFSLGNNQRKDSSVKSNALTVFYNGRTQINTTGFTTKLFPDDVKPKAALDVVSNNTGVLFPKLSNAQRDSIDSADRVAGLLLYNSTVNSFQYYNGQGWKSVETGAGGAVQPVADSSTIVWDYNLGNKKSVTLAGNRALSILNTINGSEGTLIVRQDATGNRKLKFPAGSLFIGTGKLRSDISMLPNALNILDWLYDGTNYFWTLRSAVNSSFSPAQYTNLAAWYRSDTAVTLSGSDVVTWDDISGNGRHLNTVSSTARPVIQSNQLNGYPVIYGDGTKNLRTAAAFPVFTALTVYIVASQESGDNEFGVFIDANFDKGFHIRRHFAQDQVTAGADGYITPYGATQSLNNSTFYTLRLRSDNKDSYLSVNNNGETVFAELQRPIEPSALTLFSDPNNYYFGKKRIAEIIVYTGEQSEGQRAQVEDYLKRKYAHY